MLHVIFVSIFQTDSERYHGCNSLDSDFSDASQDGLASPAPGPPGPPHGQVSPQARGTGRKRGRPKGSGTGRGRASKGASPSSSPKPVNFLNFSVCNLSLVFSTNNLSTS